MTAQTARTLTVLLPLPPRELSSNGSHLHWARHQAYANEYRTACGLVALAAWRQAGQQGSPPMARAALAMRWIYCRTAGTGWYCPLDAGNAISAFKAGQDSLVNAGILPDDDAAHLELGRVTIERHRGHRRGQCQSGVEITIRELA